MDMVLAMDAKKHSALYRYIETQQGQQDFGTVLDAGTGVNSLRWIADLQTKAWTAVCASATHAELVQSAIKDHQRETDRFVVGNWIDPKLLKGEHFDTVIADYLLGAVEGFSPYFQPYLFQRLKPLTKHRLYVTGLEPYVPVNRPDDTPGHLLWEIGRFRDASVLLCGGVPYREYPAQWVIDQLRIAGFDICSLQHFPTRYKKQFVNAQIDIGMSGLDHMRDCDLARSLKSRGETLRKTALDYIQSQGALSSGRNYVIAADVN